MKKKGCCQKMIRKLKKKLDRIFSKYIRLRDKNICYTCGKFARHAGHYISRSFLPTRFLELNVHAQCIKCNTYLGGNIVKYRQRLIEDYGIDEIEELEQYAYKQIRYDIEWYQTRIKYYQQEIKRLEG